MTAIHLETTGMHCAECPPRIESELGHLPGVKHVLAYRSLGLTSVMFDETIVDVATIQGAIKQAGFAARVVRRGPRDLT
jgi:copper chaperone CopZ